MLVCPAAGALVVGRSSTSPSDANFLLFGYKKSSQHHRVATTPAPPLSTHTLSALGAEQRRAPPASSCPGARAESSTINSNVAVIMQKSLSAWVLQAATHAPGVLAQAAGQKHSSTTPRWLELPITKLQMQSCSDRD